jgi:pyruvate-formate lyase-activating enzyme
MKQLKVIIISLFPLIPGQPQIKEDAHSGIGHFTADLDPTTATWVNPHLPQGQDYTVEFLL